MVNAAVGNTTQTNEVDVVIVGAGPTGMTLAALLGQQGRSVCVLERYAGPYHLPRAAAFDDETMRTFQKLGIAERMLSGVNVQPGYVWVNGQDEVLLDISFDNPGRSGWPAQFMMYQPHVETVLNDHVAAMPDVVVRYDSAVTGLVQGADQVEVQYDSAEGSRSLTATYVVGCDGGNSFVRSMIGSELDDYGFFENWLVCDFELRRELSTLPAFKQVCNPVEPIAIVNIGPRHHRFSFRLQADTSREEAVEPSRVWARVADYLGPDDAELARVANYTFRSCIADHWRDQRILLAGDAAHQMPPFLAQGMVSGIRDARNLSWKLGLVLDGYPESLLDTYQAERSPHVRFITERAVELGRVQTMRDETQARERDRTMLAARAANEAPDKLVYPGLSGGLIANCGEIFPQGLVSDGRRTALMDDVVGTGWLLVADSAQTIAAVAEVDLAAVGEMNGRAVNFGLVGTYGPSDLSDTGGVYARWFAQTGCVAAIVRPDSYVYGLARDADELAALAAELTMSLRAADLAGSPASPAPVDH